MPTRRQTLASGIAIGVTAALPAAARDNPMPDELRRLLERDKNPPVLGNPDGDITLTEFFDYNCGYCRKMAPQIPTLISAEPKLRIAFREWPVFGEGSEFAARAALAARQQDKYWQMHSGLMSMKDRAAEASVLRVARAVGLDIDQLRTDMDSADVSDHINHSFLLGDHMSLVGTPTWIAGDEALFGETSIKELRALIARGRAALAG